MLKYNQDYDDDGDDGGDDNDGDLAGRAASSRETRGSGSQATSASKTTFSSRLT